jgi:cAMP-dependent protein kinase regulator
MKNEKAIKEYKRKFKNKDFKEKAPTRGMSMAKKPARLVNVFGPSVGDENVADYRPPVFKKTAEANEMIRKTIAKNFFFDDMHTGDLPVFIDAFEPFEVEKDSHIISQGDKGDFFYIVGENGSVSFVVNGNKVGKAGEGSAFGELALLYSCPRAATVVAESSPTNLYRVGQKTFRALLQKQTKRKEAEKMKLLKAVDFLSEISRYDLKRLGRAMALNNFEPGDCLVRKGDEGDAFYILNEGRVDVTNISVGSTKFDDVTLEAGAYFGERVRGRYSV